jgi:hypothetical protein
MKLERRKKIIITNNIKNLCLFSLYSLYLRLYSLVPVFCFAFCLFVVVVVVVVVIKNLFFYISHLRNNKISKFVNYTQTLTNTHTHYVKIHFKLIIIR